MRRKIRFRAVIVVAFPILMIFGVTSCRWQERDELRPVSVVELDQAILGALVYLDDTQVRDRSGTRSCRYDSSDEGDGCLSDEPDISMLLPMAPPMNQHIANRSGEWSSFIYHLPGRFRIDNLPFVRSQDSNLFVTAFVAYSLLLFESDTQGADASPVESVLEQAIGTVQGYQRYDGYSFWPTATSGQEGEGTSVAPLNVPMATVEQFARDFLDPESTGSVRSLFGGELVTGIGRWVEEVMTNPDNTQGIAAVFNVPNDADDTALALGLLKLYTLRHNRSDHLYDPAILGNFGAFRDIDRAREDGRDVYKGISSGAFLTWLRDEDEPLYRAPSKGVIPLGVNNVDAVVNANVLFALSLHGASDMAGYRESLALLDRVVRERSWPAAALYYPQRMMFPYALTRAYRDGGAGRNGLKDAMKILLSDLLQEQNLDPHQPKLYGSFRGASGAESDLSTALACSALLNMGESIAIEAGQHDAYVKALDAGIVYLLRNKEIHLAQNPETLASWEPAPQGYRWGADLIFSASFPQLVEWRSEAFSVAMVLEALAKYRVGYQHSDRPIAEAPAIRPMRPVHDAAAWGIQVTDR